MSEQVSALMDDELDGVECEGCLKRLRDDETLRESWSTYHLIGDAMRGTAATGFSAAFAKRLADEPTVLAPGRAAPRRKSRPAVYALSAAASVAAVAAVAWTALPLIRGPALGPQLAGSNTVISAADVQPAVAAVVPTAQGVADYLLAHQRFSPRSAMAGTAPYVRTVADESGNR
jgi:sigma-E factor negative regulatory protein RseA